jgi:hypothetical protein
MSDTFDWQEIDSNNLISFKNGCIFKKPKNADTIKISCSVCTVLISTIEDIESSKECGCCQSCKDIYYIPNKDRWLKGWRPIYE